jgi:pimeloyl-ACP methyl ester carboxylesterase
MAVFKNNSREMYYEIHGQKGPWVLLIMGFATQGDAWQFQVKELKKEYRVITYDHYGTGESRPYFSTLNFTEISNDLNDFLDYLGIDSVNIIGLSMGGMIALEFACEFREKVSSVALMATTMGGYRGRLSMLGSVLPLSKCFIGTPRSQYKSLIKSLFPESFSKSKSKDWFIEKLRLKKKRIINYSTVFFQTIASFNHNVEKKINMIQGKPVLIIVPERDIIVKPEESYRIKKKLKGSRMIKLVDGGHGVHLQYIEEINKILLSHLDNYS